MMQAVGCGRRSHPVSLQRGPRAELWGVEAADTSSHQLPDCLRVCPCAESHLPEVRLLLGVQLLLTGQGVGVGVGGHRGLNVSAQRGSARMSGPCPQLPTMLDESSTVLLLSYSVLFPRASFNWCSSLINTLHPNLS